MVGWGQGRAEIDQLIDRGELQRVVPDPVIADGLLEDSRRHLRSAARLCDNDPNAAFSILYDAARKACSALLEVQGLRATSSGGHVAVRAAVMAQFGDLPGGKALQSFDRLRRRRNAIEYPGGATSADEDEVAEGLERATGIVQYAERLVGHLPPY